MHDKKVELKVLDISSSLAQAHAYALVLQEVEGNRHLPVIIGSIEAQAIAMKLKEFIPPRPFTHDLFTVFSKAFQINLKEVFIYKVIEGVYYSYLYFEKDGKMHEIDSRTSDAVALALRFGAPIYTTEKILETESIRIGEEGNFSPPITSVDIPVLKESLARAVEEENYELASQLRDEIRKREQQQKEEKPIKE